MSANPVFPTLDELRYSGQQYRDAVNQFDDDYGNEPYNSVDFLVGCLLAAVDDRDLAIAPDMEGLAELRDFLQQYFPAAADELGSDDEPLAKVQEYLETAPPRYLSMNDEGWEFPEIFTTRQQAERAAQDAGKKGTPVEIDGKWRVLLP